MVLSSQMPKIPDPDYSKMTPKEIWEAEEQRKVFEAQEKAEKAAKEAADRAVKAEVKQQAEEDEWTAFATDIKHLFPDNIGPVEITPQQRLVAIALAMGWTDSKISRASGIPRSTVILWKNKPSIKYFARMWQYHKGEKPINDYFLEGVFESARVIKEIIVNPLEKSATRLEAARVFLDRALGKPVETVVNRGGANLRDIIEKLNQEQAIKVDQPPTQPTAKPTTN